MDDLQFYILFNNNSVLSGWWVGDNERLCAMELSLRKDPSLKFGSNLSPLDQQGST